MRKEKALLGALVMVMAACSHVEDLNVPTTPQDNNKLEVRATIESVTSRAAIDNGKITWSAGDQIAALLNDGSYATLTLNDGCAGQASGTFTGVLIGDKGLAEEGFHAFYPANIIADKGDIVLPDSYNVGTDYQNSNALMKAEGTDNLTFKHLGGVIKLDLKSVPPTTSKIRFTTLDNQNISGQFEIQKDANDVEYLQATAGDGSNSSIEICFDPLAETSDIEVSIPLPVGTYTGIRLEFMDNINNVTVNAFERTGAVNNIKRAARVAMPTLTCVAVTGGAEGTPVADGVYQEDESTYIITNANGMLWVAKQVNDQIDNFALKTIKLGKNIDLKDVEWTPIGLSTGYKPEFAGTFDGNGKTIYNLTVTDTRPDKAAAGLFGYVTTEHVTSKLGAIRNLTIDGANVRSTHYAGAVAAWAQGGFVIENCHVTNSTIISQPEQISGNWDNGDKVGGVVGYIAQKVNGQGTSVKDCTIENSTVGGYRDIGGIIGYINKDGVVTGNTVGANVNIVQDMDHSYKSAAEKVLSGYVFGNAESGATISGNSGTANITVKVYDTATAQLALDAATSGRTIELAAGTYGSMELRHTKPTTVITKPDGHPNYLRTLANLTIKPAAGANVTIGKFVLNAGHNYDKSYNYVTDKAISSGANAYYAYFNLQNIVIDGFTLTENVYIGSDSNTPDNQLLILDGFTLKNCRKIGTDATKKKDDGEYTGNKLIRIGNGTNRLLNVRVLNCTAKDVFQGVYAYGTVDYTVEGCTFDNLGHNVFQVGAGRSTFQNNTIRNCNTDRLFRINVDAIPDGDWVKILNNVITNSTGDASDATWPYIKIGGGYPGTNVTFSGNTMDGNDWSPFN